MRKKADLLISRGKILTLNKYDSIIDPGDIAVKKNTIVEIGPNLEEKYLCPQILDASGKLVMPGLINTHLHAAMSLFRGLADDLSLMDWLQNHIFPAESKFMNPDNVYLGSLLACLEMIKSGTTTLCDGYFFESEAARAVQDAGLRGMMAQGIIDFPCPDSANPHEGLRMSEEFISQCQNSDRIRPALFCHSAYTCSPKTLRETKKLAQKYAVPFCIHLSETKQEIEQIQRQYGKRPVHHLADLGILDETVIAAHCVWLNQEEIDVLKRFEVKVAHVPESNMKLASGIAPVPALLRKGIAIGLGTDGSASNNDLDLFCEMDTTAKLHKVTTQDPTCLKAKEVVHMATLGGAKVLNLSHEIGSLEVGKKADIIILDLKKPHLLPLYNLYSHLVYTFKGADVNSVVVDGHILMKDRKFTHLDENEILGQVIKLSTLIKKDQTQ